MGYQIIQGDPTEFTVPEYPTFNDEKEFHRLLVRTAEGIVPRDQKDGICEKWGWDPDEVIREEVTGYQKYHLELARVIFENGDELSPEDKGNVRPGLVQEARTDFIEGCQGRSQGLPGSSTEALQQMVASLIGQNGTTEETTASD